MKLRFLKSSRPRHRTCGVEFFNEPFGADGRMDFVHMEPYYPGRTDTLWSLFKELSHNHWAATMTARGHRHRPMGWRQQTFLEKHLCVNFV